MFRIALLAAVALLACVLLVACAIALGDALAHVGYFDMPSPPATELATP